MLPATGYRIMYPQTTIRAILQPGPLQEAADDLLGGEVLFRDLPRRPAIAGIVALDGVQCGEDVVHRAEPEQPFPDRQELAEPGFLGDHGAPGGQVTGTAIAE